MGEKAEDVQPTRAVLMDRAEYSVYRGWKPRQTTRYINKGIIKLVGKLIDREQADKAIAFYADPVEGAHNVNFNKDKKGKGKKEAAALNSISYSEARTKKEIALAKLNELKVQELEGILLL